MTIGLETTFNYKPYTIAELWRKYQDKKDKGIDEAYINNGDIVLLQSKTYLKNTYDSMSDTSDYSKKNHDRIVECGGMLMTVVQSCKVSEDLWYTTVVGLDGKDIILIDDDIKMVYKPITKD